MKTWPEFINGPRFGESWADRARAAARLVLALPDDATDEQIEAARIQGQQVAVDRAFHAAFVKSAQEFAQHSLDRQIELARERDAARAELAAIKSAAPVTSREELASRLATAADPGLKMSVLNQAYWSRVADAALRLLRAPTDGDEVVRLKAELDAAEISLSRAAQRNVAVRKERDELATMVDRRGRLMQGLQERLAEMTANHAAASEARVHAEAATEAALKTVADLRHALSEQARAFARLL